MTSDLSDKVALVTGGASGIGRASVLALSGAGAAVAVLDRDRAGADAVVAQVKEAGGRASAIMTDLSQTPRISESVASVLQEFGRIDFLINCAGVAGKFQTLLEIDDHNWDFVHTVNLKAPMLLMQQVARHMIDRGGGGRIINISSSSAFRARNSPIAYATSKAALASLTREMASDFGRVGVRVNAIAPGEIDTSILSPGTEKIVEQNIPMHRLGTPDEVAKIIYVLCTETSSYVNGAEIHINGGQHV